MNEPPDRAASSSISRTSYLPRALAPVALLVGVVATVLWLDRFRHHSTWIFWDFARVYGYTALFVVACLSSGSALLVRLRGRTLPLLEHVTQAFALGVLAFHTVMALFGFAHLFRPWAFWAVPLLLIAAGARDTLRYGLRLARHLRHRRAQRINASPLVVAALTAAGVLGTAILYFPIISPSHAGFDSIWYHLPIAEHYLAAGGIVPFAEGWYLGTYPQLSSLLYAWGMMGPGETSFVRLETAAHIEFALFLFTLIGVPALARRVVRGARLSAAWVVVFLFPLLFLHDTAMAADHVAAFWACPVYLAFFRAWEELDPREGALLGAMLGGGLLVKFTIAPLLLFPILAIVVRAIWLGVPAGRRAERGTVLAALRASRGAFVAGGTMLAVSSPFWLRNWVFYGGPLYPLLHSVFHYHPWHEDAALLVDIYTTQIGTFPAPHTVEGVLDTARSLGAFAFTAYEFPEYHRDIPYFGFLFTLTTLAIPFLSPTRRMVALVVGAYSTIAVWYWLSHVDRYLQSFLPLYAVVTAVALAGIWRSGRLGQLAVAVAVLFQMVWGADVFAVPSQRLKYNRALEVVGTSFEGQTKDFSRSGAHWAELGRRTPPDAVLLMHDIFDHLGTERRCVNDWMGLQGGINYGSLRSLRAVWEKLHSLGVTHLVVPSSNKGDDSLAGDIRFGELATRYTDNAEQIGHTRLSAMRPQPPPERPGPDRVLYLGCETSYHAGLYELSDLNVPTLGGTPRRPYPLPRTPLQGANVNQLLTDAQYAVSEKGCQDGVASQLPAKRFVSIGQRGALTLWSR